MRQTKGEALEPHRVPAASKVLTGRRALLVGLPALGVGAGLALGRDGSEASAETQTAASRHEPRYSETDHIRTYYAVARS